MSKEAIIKRVRALLNKTVDNGCTEEESMIAASKAAEIMDQHDIQTLDLAEESVFVEFVRPDVRNDVMKRGIALAVNKYCGCYGMYLQNSLKVVGRDIDIIMAEWLFDTLVAHVSRGLKKHMSGNHTRPSNEKTRIKNGFNLGAVYRISERLQELMQDRVIQSNALVLCREGEARDSFMKKFLAGGGIVKNARKKKAIRVSADSMEAGRKCADKANINRQISA